MLWLLPRRVGRLGQAAPPCGRGCGRARGDGRADGVLVCRAQLVEVLAQRLVLLMEEEVLLQREVVAVVGVEAHRRRRRLEERVDLDRLCHDVPAVHAHVPGRRLW